MVWIFCLEMTPAQFPKSDLWNFCWIFCPEMTLAQFPEFGFFVQNSRIGVKGTSVPGRLRSELCPLALGPEESSFL